MDGIEKYVNRFLSNELNSIENDALLKLQDNILNIFEKAIVFKYTTDGYIEINELLRISQGKRYNKLGLLLKGILHKLPNYTRFVYRGVDLTDEELQRYIDADNNGTILIEYSFLSTSKSRAITYFSDKKVKFTIRSKTGKDIEAYSKYGAYTSRNEKEVLFTPNCKFNVLEVRKDKEYTLIIMEEI